MFDNGSMTVDTHDQTKGLFFVKYLEHLSNRKAALLVEEELRLILFLKSFFLGPFCCTIIDFERFLFFMGVHINTPMRS